MTPKVVERDETEADLLPFESTWLRPILMFAATAMAYQASRGQLRELTENVKKDPTLNTVSFGKNRFHRCP